MCAAASYGLHRTWPQLYGKLTAGQQLRGRQQLTAAEQLTVIPSAVQLFGWPQVVAAHYRAADLPARLALAAAGWPQGW
jgi:hypothetical protein